MKAVSRTRRAALAALLGCAPLCPSGAAAETLMSGSVAGADGKTLAFELIGKTAEELVGGALRLGEREFLITAKSVHRLLGGERAAGDDAAEYAVFSSSYSPQTATGQPWVAGRRYLHCDRPYNTFLAVYRVSGAAALKAVQDKPYSLLADDLANSSDSTVYCFYAEPVDDALR